MVARPLSAVGLVAVVVAFVAGGVVAGGVVGPAGAAPTASASSPYTGSQGARGIGDPYFPLDGNGGYDVVHYDIADTYDTPTGDLSGQTTVTAVATQDLSRFDLDLVLTTDSVSVDGQAAAYHGGAHELVITPATPIADGQQFSVVVTYHGDPATIGYGGEHPWESTRDEALATNEPHIAPWWFAVNDHPSDKATYDITVSVPKGEQVVSNGTLVSHQLQGSLTAWHWRMDQPISSYLAFFAAGSFLVRRGEADGIPYTIAASKRLADPESWLTLLADTPAIVAWEESQFGPYPFSSTGGLVTSVGRDFSLENATRPTYSTASGVSTLTMVHELAHQWFGDDVSVHRWSDIWLNEGFATYAEWRYTDTHGGEDLQTHLLRVYGEFGAGSAFWQRVIADPGSQHLFGDPVYTRGAMALAALRHRIGGDVFDTLMRTWVSDHAGGNASVADFEALAASVSGEDLDGFFQAWLFTPAKPAQTKANGLV